MTDEPAGPSYDWRVQPYWGISLAVNKSRRYHSAMQNFYERSHDLIMAINAIFGASAFIALFGGKGTELAKWLTAVVAIGSAIDTTFGLSKRAKRHADLSRRFTELAADILKKPATPVNARWAAAERVKIERDEPPVRRLIDIQANNEEMRSRGVDPAYQTPLRPDQRFLGYVFTYGMGRLERLEDERQRRRLAAEAEADRAAAAVEEASSAPQAENSANVS